MGGTMGADCGSGYNALAGGRGCGEGLQRGEEPGVRSTHEREAEAKAAAAKAVDKEARRLKWMLANKRSAPSPHPLPRSPSCPFLSPQASWHVPRGPPHAPAPSTTYQRHAGPAELLRTRRRRPAPRAADSSAPAV
jgi:hypothetical protein